MSREIEMREGEELFRLRTPALVVGLVGLAGLLVGAFLDPDQFFRSWLMGWVLLVMIATGSLGVIMIHSMTGGRWGVLMKRPAEAAASTLPIVALGFIPVVLGIHSIYAWSHAELLAHDALLRHKSIYLNETAFTVRGVVYFIIWSALAMALVRVSTQLDRNADPWIDLRRRRIAGAGLLILGFTLSFAAIDWLMSLEPHWYSTMYGISFVIGCLLSGWAVLTFSVVRLTRSEPYAGIAETQNFRDFGNMMLAFVMLWAYTAFSQFLLIWYGNIREEVPYYIIRMHGGWGVIATALLLFHFFLPFVLLLMRPIKDRPRTLGLVAVLVLVMRMVDIFWIAAPAWSAGHGEEAARAAPAFHLSWMDPLAFVALLALWYALFLRNLGRRPLLPQYEPIVKEAATHA